MAFSSVVRPSIVTSVASNLNSTRNEDSTSSHNRAGIYSSQGICLNRNQAVATKHTGKAKQRTACPICGIIMLKKVLQRDLDSVHGHGSYCCGPCGQSFGRRDFLDRHAVEQHGVKAGAAGTVQCTICGKKVRSRALKDHFESKACKTAKAQSDPEEMRHGPNLMRLTWMDTIYRFDASTVLEPWQPVESALTELASFEAPLRNLGITIPGSIWELRGMALRTLSRYVKSTKGTSEDKTVRNILAMTVLDSSLGQVESVYLHLNALCGLQELSLGSVSRSL